MLALKLKDLSLIPRTHIGKLNVAIYTYNLSSGETEARGSPGLSSQPHRSVSVSTPEKPCLSKQQQHKHEECLRNKSQGWPLHFALMHTCIDASQENPFSVYIWHSLSVLLKTRRSLRVSDMKSSLFNKRTDECRQLHAVLVHLACCDKNTLTKKQLMGDEIF